MDVPVKHSSKFYTAWCQNILLILYLYYPKIQPLQLNPKSPGVVITRYVVMVTMLEKSKYRTTHTHTDTHIQSQLADRVALGVITHSASGRPRVSDNSLFMSQDSGECVCVQVLCCRVTVSVRE